MLLKTDITVKKAPKGGSDGFNFKCEITEIPAYLHFGAIREIRDVKIKQSGTKEYTDLIIYFDSKNKDIQDFIKIWLSAIKADFKNYGSVDLILNVGNEGCFEVTGCHPIDIYKSPWESPMCLKYSDFVKL